jgi:type I restriction enzyme, S subunit
MSKAWPLVKLGEVISQRKEFITIDDTQEYMRCRVQLHAKGIVLRDRVTGSEIKTKQQQVCRAGEFLVAEIDAKVGGFGIIPDELEDSIVSSHYFLFTVDSAKLNNEFLDFYSKTPTFREQVNAKGSTNYAAIRPQEVLNYTIPLPPLAEQQRIVAKIKRLTGKIEEARELRKQVSVETEATISSLARNTFSKINESQTRMIDWLDSCREGIQTGPFGAQLGRGDFCQSGVPLLTIGNVQFNGLSIKQLTYVSEVKAAQLSRYRIRKGDILFARMGTVGRCCVVPKEAEGWLINYHIIRLAINQKLVNPKFIHWTIKASEGVENYLSEMIRGATRAGVNSTIVGSLPCRIPTLDQQNKIVECLDDLQTKIDYLKVIQAQTTAELDALLPSILDKAFKGEL